jgi:hypothetical protein
MYIDRQAIGLVWALHLGAWDAYTQDANARSTHTKGQGTVMAENKPYVTTLTVKEQAALNALPLGVLRTKYSAARSSAADWSLTSRGDTHGMGDHKTAVADYIRGLAFKKYGVDIDATFTDVNGVFVPPVKL